MIAPDDDAVLEHLRHKLARVTAEPGIGTNAVGVPDWDRQLWHRGRKWIDSNSGRITQSASPPGGRKNDVYLATQVAADSGSTPLIGDFVRALADESGTIPPGSASHLIMTNIVGENPPPLAESVRERPGVPAANIIVLEDGSLAQCMEQLFAHLLELQPLRLFLFRLPVDPLTAVVTQPEISGGGLGSRIPATGATGVHQALWPVAPGLA